jgi:phosphoglycerate dehydrogenase-like enzyme
MTMRVAFLDPLEGIARDLYPQFLGEHEVLIAPSNSELPAGWQEAEAAVWSRWPVDQGLIESMPQLRFMQRLGRFRARGDARPALDRGIQVSVFAHGTSGRVAEHTLALILGLFRGLLASHRAVVNGDNPAGLTPEIRNGPTPTVNWAQVPHLQSLQFKTVGIAGFGEIGACLALMLAPLNCRVLYFKRTPLRLDQEEFFNVERVESLEGLLRGSDAVVDLVPVSDATHNMFGAREFGLMKSSAYFVNPGRGWTVDEDALVQALAQDQIGGAGIDTFTLEPLPPGHPITKLENVLLTPHTAGGTPQGAINGLAGWSDVFERLNENLRRVSVGEPVLSPMRSTDPQPEGS